MNIHGEEEGRQRGQGNNRQAVFVLQGIWIKHRKELIDKLALASASLLRAAKEEVGNEKHRRTRHDMTNIRERITECRPGGGTRPKDVVHMLPKRLGRGKNKIASENHSVAGQKRGIRAKNDEATSLTVI